MIICSWEYTVGDPIAPFKTCVCKSNLEETHGWSLVKHSKLLQIEAHKFEYSASLTIPLLYVDRYYKKRFILLHGVVDWTGILQISKGLRDSMESEHCANVEIAYPVSIYIHAYSFWF